MKIKIRIWTFIAAISIALSLGLPSAIVRADEMTERQEKHLAMLKERLNLTDGQVNEIRAIMESARLQGERDREKYREARDPEGGRKAAIIRQKDTEEKIRAVLNDKQKKQYDKFREEMEKRRDKGGDRSNGPGGKGPMGNMPHR